MPIPATHSSRLKQQKLLSVQFVSAAFKFGGMARAKKPTVEIKREKTSLGWAYSIYIGGMYMGTGLTRASARDAVQQLLAAGVSR